MFNKYRKKIIFSVVFGACVFLGLSIYANFTELLAALNVFNWLLFPLILTCAFCNYIARFFKWNYYTKVLDINIPVKLSFMIFLSSFIMAVTPGKVGEVFKSYLLKEQVGTPISRSAPIVLAERITDFLSLILLSIIGAVTFNYGIGLIVSIGILFILLIAIISSKKISYAIIGSLERFKYVTGISHKIHSAYDSIYRMIHLKELLYALLLSVIAWFFECFAFFIVVNSFGIASIVHIDIFVATFIYGFATIAGAVTMLPGGLGVTDASIPFLLILLKGVPKNISVASSLIIRIATLWFAVFVGIIAILVYQKTAHKKLNQIALNL